MKKHPCIARLASIGMAAVTVLAAYSLHAQPKGQWDFDNGNLNATVGTALTPKVAGTQFGTTTSFGLPNIGGQPANVMQFPAAPDANSGYQAAFTAVPNGGGGLVNEWTVLMDILFPAASSAKVRALVETDLGALGNPDADAFVRADNQFGTKGAGFGNIATNTWYRLGIVAAITSGTAGELRFYIDGVQVGVVGIANMQDQRYALNGTIEFFTDDNGETQLGFVNSLQLRDVALTKGQMSALGAATASGIPQTLPPVPSFIDRWIPSGQFASRTTPLGAVIDPGSTTIQDSSLSLTLDNQVLASPVITRANSLITIQKDAGALTIGDHTLIVRLTDSVSGARSFTNKFTAALFYEDFEGIKLDLRREEGNAVAEPLQWTNRPPVGWSVDNSQFKAVVITADNPDTDGDGFADLDGRTEWAGWAFANKGFWIASDNQTRDQFALGQGTIAIADPDEWDDSSHIKGFFNSFLKTPPISLVGVAANSAFLAFASSWRPEAVDDGALNDLPTGFPVGPTGQQINNQTAIITASYDGGTPVQVLKWDSIGGSPTFHPDSQNEAVLLQLNNPANATSVVLSFAMVEAANDWWWAVDNIVVNAGATPPSVAQQPKLAVVTAGESAALSVTAGGQGPFTYQWFKGPSASKAPVANATNSVLNFAATTVADAAFYSVEITGPGGKVSSSDTRLVVAPSFVGSITNQLVVHLKFDNNSTDFSGRGNNGTPVVQPESTNGLPAYVSSGEQRVGTHALRILDGQHIGLGMPTDLSFGADTHFTVAFWAKGEAGAWTGDPSFFGNKNWTSGGNPGLVFSAQGGGQLKLNWKAAVNPRLDTPNVGSLNDTNWHHIAGTFDRQGLVTIYVDGQAASLSDIAGAGDIDALDYNIGQDGTGRYGFDNDLGAHFLKIWMDDFGVWRRALTPAEINAIFTAAQSGKSLAEAVVGAVTKPGTPTLTLSEVKALNATLTATGSAFVGAGATDTLAASILQFSTSTAFSAGNGLSNILFSVTNNARTLTVNASRFFPGRTYYASIQYQDQAARKSDFTVPVAFTVGQLPTPLLLETFESVADGGVPTGWTRSNQTDALTAGIDLNNPDSDSYRDWTVVPFSVLQTLGGDRPDTNVVSGKSMYAESDNRGGNQIQYLLSPEFNLAGQRDIWVAFKSNYKQNQDSLGVMEYTVDGGATWLPVVYLLNDRPNNTDIVRNPDGTINALTTLTNTATDIAKIIDPATGLRVAAGKYADFVLARPLDALGSFLSGRIDDDGTESKRHERFRLANADGQARVQFRFVQAGTGSWWWGLDDFALYSQPTKPATPTLALSDVQALASSFGATGSAFVGVGATDTLAATIVQVSASNAFSLANGLSNIVFSITNASSAVALNVGSARLFPGRTYYSSIAQRDQNGIRSDFSTPVAFTVGQLPTPLLLETFESVTDGGVPTGWTRSNQTDALTAGIDLNNPDSDSYRDWTVVPLSVLQTLGGDRPDTNVVSGKSIYAESDNRGGNQIQYLLSPEFNLAGQRDIWVAFKSNYKQNQDSFAAMEYTVDGGATWLPVVYLLNDRPNNTDIVRNPDGTINALTTLTNTATDIAKIIDPATGLRVAAGKYADFVLARPLDALGSFLSGRIDDDGTESKRHERFRLANADGQARVQFRFVQAGTGSWWWGLDDFGFYVAESSLVLGISRQPTGIVLTWTGTATLEQTDNLANGTWTPVSGAVSGQLLPVNGSEKYFRLRR